MQAFLDGEPLDAKDASFAAAVSAAAASSEKQHRIIVQVMADGHAVSDECLQDPLRSTVSAQRLEFVSVAPEQLVATTLENAADVLGETRATQLAAAEQLQLGEQEQAFVQLGPVLETWSAVQAAVQNSAAVLKIDVTVLGTRAGVELKPLIAGLSSHLGQLKNAIEAKDWSSAADTLAYDLDSQCEQWTIALKKLSESLGKAAGTRG